MDILLKETLHPKTGKIIKTVALIRYFNCFNLNNNNNNCYYILRVLPTSQYHHHTVK